MFTIYTKKEKNVLQNMCYNKMNFLIIIKLQNFFKCQTQEATFLNIVFSYLKVTKVNSKILLMKSLKKYFIFLPAFYLIRCLMKSPKNFEKIAILKKWQLISFWGVKIHFGEKYAWFAIEYWFLDVKVVFLICYGPKK